MSGAPVESLSVVTQQDRSFSPFPDGEVDGTGGSRNEGYEGRLVALADDAQDAVSSFDGHVLDIGLAGLADAQAVEAEEDGWRRVGVVEALRGEQESAEFTAVQSAALGRVHGRTAYVLGRIGGDAAVDVREAVEATSAGQSPVDR
jgi:hypothetical protein